MADFATGEKPSAADLAGQNNLSDQPMLETVAWPLTTQLMTRRLPRRFSGSVPPSLKWSGPTLELHRQLTASVGKAIAVSSRWPKHVSRFSGELRRLAPQLRERGLSIAFSRSRDQRLISLTYDNDWAFRHPHRNHHGS